MGGEGQVGEVVCGGEKRCYLLVGEAGNAAADTCDEESLFGVLPRVKDKLIDIGSDRFHAALHRRNGVTPAGRADTDAPFGAELLVRDTRRSSSVKSLEVAAKNENLVGGQRGNKFRSSELLHRCAILSLFCIFILLNQKHIPLISWLWEICHILIEILIVYFSPQYGIQYLV